MISWFIYITIIILVRTIRAFWMVRATIFELHCWNFYLSTDDQWETIMMKNYTVPSDIKNSGTLMLSLLVSLLLFMWVFPFNSITLITGEKTNMKIFKIYVNLVQNVAGDMEEVLTAEMCKNLVDLTIDQTKLAVEIP